MNFVCHLLRLWMQTLSLFIYMLTVSVFNETQTSFPARQCAVSTPDNAINSTFSKCHNTAVFSDVHAQSRV